MYIAGIVVDAGGRDLLSHTKLHLLTQADIASGAGKHAEAVGLRQVSRFLIVSPSVCRELRETAD